MICRVHNCSDCCSDYSSGCFDQPGATIVTRPITAAVCCKPDNIYSILLLALVATVTCSFLTARMVALAATPTDVYAAHAPHAPPAGGVALPLQEPLLAVAAAA